MIAKNTAVNVVLGVLFSLVQMANAQAAVSYAPPTSTAAAAGPDFIAKGNLNGDADIDLVSVNAAAGSVTVLLSDGVGGFSSVTNHPVGNTPRWVAIGDLDGVNGDDLAVTNSALTSGTGSITVLLNDGNGGYTEASGSPIDIEALAGVGAEPFSLVIAQLNSSTDLFRDIAISNEITNNVQILLGVGNGTFTTGATIAVGTKPISIAAGSVDTTTDALTDLVVGNYTSNTVSVLLGDGAGGFTDASGSPFATTSSRPFNVTIASIDSLADSIPDIALVNYINAVQTVEVFQGAGDGTFTSIFVSSKLAGRPRSVAVADLDGDSDLDLAIASDNTGTDSPVAAVTVFLGDGSGAFPTVAQYPLSGGPKGLVSANLDNANQVDLAVANDSGNVDVLLSVPTANAPVANDGFLQILAADVGSTNVQNGTLVGTDADGALLSYAIASQPTIGTVTISDVATGTYTYDPSPGVITVPDSFTFTVDDGTGASVAGTIQVAQNDSAPVITTNGGGASAAVGVNENQTAVTIVTATDADLPAQTLTYSISGGADAAKFSIDISTGVLTFLSTPDFETPTDAGADNVYDVQVQASDNSGGVDTQDIVVTVADVNEAPVITSDGGGASAAVGVNESQTAVTTVVATDVDAGQTLTYSISGGADAAAFSIAPSTGVLTFNSAPDFEIPTDIGTDNVYDVQVTVTDDGTGPLTDVQDIAVTVANANDAPVISGGATAAVAVSENQTAVTTVTATDADTGQTLTYSISGGADAAAFNINGSSGVLTFASAPDFEVPTDAGADNVYDVQVTVIDDGGSPLTDVQDIAVTVGDANDQPVITSNGGGANAAVGANENQAAVTTVTATDADSPAQTLTYSISGGADATAFNIDSGSGVLTFASVPDFEAPFDAGANNIYDVQVQVADGSSGVDVQAIAVTVVDVNEAPVITSDGGGAGAAVSVNESQTAVTTVVATDVDAGQTLTYSISGGADAAAFSINGSSGVLTFASAPDFAAPTDADANNVYDVQVTVTDDGAGTLTDAQDVAVTVVPDTNGDGISDAQATAIGLDPQLTDTDGDGTSDATEVGGNPAAPIDTDGDGIIDALEFGAALNTLEFVVPAPTATTLSLPDLSDQQVTLSGNGAAITANNNGTTGLPLYAESNLVEDASFEYPFGVYNFNVVAPGGTATVTLTLPAGTVIPANAMVRKLTTGNQWQPFATAVIDRTANTITLTLTDNDGVFDLDNTAGIIRDPVGLAVPAAVASSGGGGGGCSLGAVPRRAGFDPILPLLILVPLLFLRRKRNVA